MLGSSTKVFTTGVPLWQTVLETAQGGFHLDTTGLPAGGILPGGTPIMYDEATRIAKPVFIGVINANAASNAVTYQVKKNSNFAVGNNVALEVGGKAYAITAIDTSNPAYDVITVGTTIGAATAGSGIFVSSATGPTAGATAAGVKGYSYEDYDLPLPGEIQQIAVVLRGTAYARRIPPVPASIKATTPLIIFSDSY